MRFLLLVSAAVVFAFAGLPKASAWEMQISNETNADGSLPYADFDDALQDSVDRGRGMPTYQFEAPRFGSARPDAAEHSAAPWDAAHKRLVFGPFNDNVYAEPSAQQ